MAAQICGTNANVRVEFSGGQKYEFTGVVTMIQNTDMFDVSSAFNSQVWSVPGFTRLTLDVTPTGPPRPKKKTLAEAMARSVLDGDQAAGRALADLLCEDVILAANGFPTHDQLNARIDDLQKQLDDANERIETIQSMGQIALAPQPSVQAQALVNDVYDDFDPLYPDGP